MTEEEGQRITLGGALQRRKFEALDAIQELRGELDRLQAKDREMLDALTRSARRQDELEAERDSLRAALEHMQKIARAIGTGPAEAVWDGCKTLDDIARQALTSEKESKREQPGRDGITAEELPAFLAEVAEAARTDEPTDSRRVETALTLVDELVVLEHLLRVYPRAEWPEVYASLDRLAAEAAEHDATHDVAQPQEPLQEGE